MVREGMGATAPNPNFSEGETSTRAGPGTQEKDNRDFLLDAAIPGQLGEQHGSGTAPGKGSTSNVAGRSA